MRGPHCWALLGSRRAAQAEFQAAVAGFEQYNQEYDKERLLEQVQQQIEVRGRGPREGEEGRLLHGMGAGGPVSPAPPRGAGSVACSCPPCSEAQGSRASRYWLTGRMCLGLCGNVFLATACIHRRDAEGDCTAWRLHVQRRTRRLPWVCICRRAQ